MGFRGNAIKLLKSYLLERTQTVQIHGVKTAPRDIKIGVPQGSISGPLLFILYVNDIVKLKVEGQFMMYADDTAIFLGTKARQHYKTKSILHCQR